MMPATTADAASSVSSLTSRKAPRPHAGKLASAKVFNA